MLSSYQCTKKYKNTMTTVEDMNIKRKAESNQRAIKILRTMCGSRAESERDSGFSDASSEHTCTRGNADSEDAVLRAPQPGASCGPGSVISQLAVVGGSSYPNSSPMIFMNNVLLEQPGDTQKPLKPWGFRPEVVQQPQVVFLQPVVSHRTPASRQDPNSSRHRRPKKCLPLLKPFPKIAPHPGDSSSSSSLRGVAPAPTSSSSSSSSYSSSSTSSPPTSSRSKRGHKLTSGHRDHSHRSKRHHHHHHQKKKKSQSGGRSSKSAPLFLETPGAVALKPLPSAETAADRAPPTNINRALASEPGPSSSPAPAMQPALVPRSAHVPASACDVEPAGQVSDPNPNPETQRMRFCNTYNILSKSGLLDITLRTKELLRQNRGVQSELDRLREHTELFMQALQSPDPGVFLTLQARFRQEVTAREGDTGE